MYTTSSCNILPLEETLITANVTVCIYRDIAGGSRVDFLELHLVSEFSRLQIDKHTEDIISAFG